MSQVKAVVILKHLLLVKQNMAWFLNIVKVLVTIKAKNISILLRKHHVHEDKIVILGVVVSTTVVIFKADNCGLGIFLTRGQGEQVFYFYREYL